jgi:hypothetical protein
MICQKNLTLVNIVDKYEATSCGCREPLCPEELSKNQIQSVNSPPHQLSLGNEKGWAVARDHCASSFSGLLTKSSVSPLCQRKEFSISLWKGGRAERGEVGSVIGGSEAFASIITSSDLFHFISRSLALTRDVSLNRKGSFCSH